MLETFQQKFGDLVEVLLYWRNELKSFGKVEKGKGGIVVFKGLISFS